MAAFLLPSMEFEQPVLLRLESGRAPERVAERGVVEGRHRRQHFPHRQQLRLDAGDAREHLERGVEIVTAHAFHHRRQLVSHEPHPQLRHLVHDDEQHLAVFGRQRPLRAEQLVEVQVVAVGLGIAQVPVHRLVLQVDGAAGVLVLWWSGLHAEWHHNRGTRQRALCTLARPWT